MANEEQLNRENGSTKDVSVPINKDVTLHIPEDAIKEEFTKLQSEKQKNLDCEKVAARYFMEHPSNGQFVNGCYISQHNSFEEALKLIKDTPEPIVKELARLYEANKQLKDQALRNDGYKLAANDLSPNNHAY